MKLYIDCFQLLNQNISKYDVENGNVLHFPESRAAAALTHWLITIHLPRISNATATGNAILRALMQICSHRGSKLVSDVLIALRSCWPQKVGPDWAHRRKFIDEKARCSLSFLLRREIMHCHR